MADPLCSLNLCSCTNCFTHIYKYAYNKTQKWKLVLILRNTTKRQNISTQKEERERETAYKKANVYQLAFLIRP